MKKIMSAFIPKTNVCFHSTSKRSPPFQIFCVKLHSSTCYGFVETTLSFWKKWIKRKKIISLQNNSPVSKHAFYSFQNICFIFISNSWKATISIIIDYYRYFTLHEICTTFCKICSLQIYRNFFWNFLIK